MDNGDQTHFKLRSGYMLNIFLDSNLIDQIKKIQKNQNLKDESDVVIRAIHHYYEKIISDVAEQQDKFENEFSQNTFDGKLDLEKLEKILDSIESENIIKKLPQHKIYNMAGAGMIHRFQTKILPVKFSLMCLSKMIVEQNSPWVDLNEFKNYTLESAKIFVAKFDSSPIQNKFKVKTGFPTLKFNDSKSEHDSYLSLARSAKRFTEDFVGRKLQKHEGVQMGGACFEMGLIKAKLSEDDEKETNSGKIYVTLSESGKEFASYSNQLIDFVFKITQNEPSSVFSQQEREFYFKEILPKFSFENKFVKYLMENEVIHHSSQIKEWFEKEFMAFSQSEFPQEDIALPENTIRVHSNTIMSRLMELGIFTKEPKFKSGPYTRMHNLGDFA
jgi:hypothetical protein